MRDARAWATANETRSEPSISLCLALGASIADREKHIFDHRERAVRRDAGRRIVPCGQNSAFVGMGVSEDSGPTVFLTFADRACLKQNQSCPSLH